MPLPTELDVTSVAHKFFQYLRLLNDLSSIRRYYIIKPFGLHVSQENIPVGCTAPAFQPPTPSDVPDPPPPGILTPLLYTDPASGISTFPSHIPVPSEPAPSGISGIPAPSGISGIPFPSRIPAPLAYPPLSGIPTPAHTHPTPWKYFPQKGPRTRHTHPLEGT